MEQIFKAKNWLINYIKSLTPLTAACWGILCAWNTLPLFWHGYFQCAAAWAMTFLFLFMWTHIWAARRSNG